jgi:hypothetical protein
MFRIAPVALTALVLLYVGTTAAAPVTTAPIVAPAGLEAEVRCVDDSVLKLKILDERLNVSTRYGSLQVPVADIRRIEFATRVTPEVAERVSLLISNLNHPDFDAREKATAELRELRERAYFPLLKAIKHQDPEISRRAEETVRYIQQKVPPGQLDVREYDVIYTDDSKFTGMIGSAILRVHTTMFGEQGLRLADIRSLKSGMSIAAEEVANAPAAPTNMMAFQNQFGKEVVFTVSGAQPGAQGTGVWGTDIYTLDSNVGAAAVHAGLVKPGSTAPLKLRIVTSPAQFVGSFRNGIGSTPYGTYPAGAFEFVKK